MDGPYRTPYSLAMLYNTINLDLVYLADWFCANKLSLNISKTNYVFSRDNEVTHLDITIGNNNIELKQYVCNRGS